MTAQNENRQVDPAQALVSMLNTAMPELKSMAPHFVNVQRLTQLAIEAKMRNPLLAQCSPVSVLNFCKKCAEMGTDRIGAGGMWPVPFWNKKENAYDMTPLPDWRLIVEKAKLAKALTHATAEAVHQCDVFEYERGLNPFLRHVPAPLGKRGDFIAAYCVYQLPDGTRDFVVMDKDEIDAIRGRSKASDKGPWVTDYSEMAKKTIIKRAMKPFEGASIELTKLIELDNASLGFTSDHLLAERAPVAMPTVVQPTAEGSAAPKTEARSKKNGDNTATGEVTGIIEKVLVKQSPKNAKKPWTRYGIVIDGISYGTFDDKIGELAKSMTGEEMTLTFTDDGKYKTVVDMREPEQPEQKGEQGNGEAQDELPMGDDDEEDNPFNE